MRTICSGDIPTFRSQRFQLPPPQARPRIQQRPSPETSQQSMLAFRSKLWQSLTAYSHRHPAITDLVTDGLNLLNIAQLSGTSVAMIEKHYGHLRHDHAEAALAALVL